MIERISLQEVLFLDIETVPIFPEYSLLPERSKRLFSQKTAFKRKDLSAEEYYSSAGIYAEFGKIVCISCGFFVLKDGQRTFRIRSFAGDLEKEILENFSELITKFFSGKKNNLCAHNGKEFDFPFIARRMMVHGLKLPALLDIGGMKPWEVQLLDTMDMWRFGDYKNYTSLELLASVLGISTPKDDIDGSMICRVYWEDKDLPRIIKYCGKDVLTIAQIFLRFRGETILTEKEVKVID